MTDQKRGKLTMATIFAQTIAKAISDYRLILRRYLSQAERISKLSQLRLKDSHIYDNDVSLYHAAKTIVEDIEQNMEIPDQGYYSYSGMLKYCEYLKEYLDNYEIENGKVIHRAQKASRALIEAIQLATLSDERLNENVAKDFEKCNQIIAECGSPEQRELHLNNLERREMHNESFYQPILQHFKALLTEDEDGGSVIVTDNEFMAAESIAAA